MSAKKQKIESNEMEVNENIIENIAEDVNVAVIVEESLIDIKAIDSIRDRMEIYDKMREDVIKQARDVQKLSKLAIYSIVFKAYFNPSYFLLIGPFLKSNSNIFPFNCVTNVLQM